MRGYIYGAVFCMVGGELICGWDLDGHWFVLVYWLHIFTYS